MPVRPTRFVKAGIVGACLVLTALAAVGQEPGQESVFRSASEMVRVYVTVTDRAGRLVTGLPKTSFEVKDEGDRQPIALFDDTPVPIRLIMLLDVSSSMTRNLPMMRQGAERLLLRLLKDDLTRVGTFGGDDVELSGPFTRDLDTLRQALPESVRIGGTPLWRGIDAALSAFGPAREAERRVLLVVSDGKNADYGSGNTVSEGHVRDRARRDGVMIYCIGMTGPERSNIPGFDSRPYPGLADLAEATGGGYTEIQPGRNVVAAFARVAEELHSQYLLGFEPPKWDGRVHRIEVRVATTGATARGRRSYVAPAPASDRRR
jgi:Ca-activated chloride channel family protein